MKLVDIIMMIDEPCTLQRPYFHIHKQLQANFKFPVHSKKLMEPLFLVSLESSWIDFSSKGFPTLYTSSIISNIVYFYGNVQTSARLVKIYM